MARRHDSSVTELVQVPCRDCARPIWIRVILVGAHLNDMVALCTRCLDARIEAIRAERRSGHYGSVYRPRRKENVA